MPSSGEEIEERLARIERKQDELLSELKWLLHNQAGLDGRLARVEDSMVFRTLRGIGRIYQTRIARKKPGVSRGYAEWRARKSMDAPPGVALRKQPLVTVRLAVRNPERALLERAIASVHAQSYRQWELLGDFDDAAPAWAREKVSSGNAVGEWIAYLGENDFLSPVALEHCVAALQDEMPDVIYTDADIVNAAGFPLRPLFKPDWSPVLLRGVSYLGGLRMARADLAGEPKQVIHVRRVLYHSSDTALPVLSVEAPAASSRLVSVVICTRTAALLRRCLTGLRDRTGYSAKETIVVQHLGSSSTSEESAVAAVISEFGAKRIVFAEPFNFSEMNNRGARAASGEVLLFLNDDVEPISGDWLGRFAMRLEDPSIGAVGAKLLYPSGAIQHAGIVTWLIDGAGHPGRNLFQSDNWPWLNCTREVTAVTGACLALRRAEFERLGGFDPIFPVNYNDVDLCLRLRAAGLSVIFDANAVLLHDESQTRRPGTQYDERRTFFRRWAHVVEKIDPFYSPHLAQNNEDLSLR